MKYDDASWHYGGDFPKDLPDEAGATHIGMYVAWALLSGFAGSIHAVEFPDDLASLRRRQITPGQFFLKHCDGKFTDEDLNDDGNEFTQAYYATNSYLGDFADKFAADVPTLYHVADNWEIYDLLRPCLDERLAEWKQEKT